MLQGCVAPQESLAAPSSLCSFPGWQDSPRGTSAMGRSVPGQTLLHASPFHGWSAAFMEEREFSLPEGIFTARQKIPG